jgi:hypothetical protein
MKVLFSIPSVLALTVVFTSCAYISEETFNDRLDSDNDGVPIPDDCDDTDPSIQIHQWFVDQDNDGYGSAVIVENCTQPANTATNSDDCNDDDPLISPSEEELCDGIDNDCNFEIDDEPANQLKFYRDQDGDFFGDSEVWMESCSSSIGWVDDQTDCDDTRADINPDADEICETGVDENCNDDAYECYFSGQHWDQDANLILMGNNDNDQLGSAIAWAGEWDENDGDELWIGAPDHDAIKSNAGVASIFGANQQGQMLAEHSGQVSLWGEIGQAALGTTVLSLQDADGDGRKELVAATPSSSDNALSFVFSGDEPNTLILEPRMTLESNAGKIKLGETLAALSDLDGDGLEELLVGCPDFDYGSEQKNGAVAIVLSTEWNQEVVGKRLFLTTDSAVIYAGYDSLSLFGSSLNSAGDTSGDGIHEMIAGAPHHSDGTHHRGAVALVQPDITQSGVHIVTSQGALLLGNTKDDKFGAAVAGVGDTNGDGYDDILIGAPFVDDGNGHDNGNALLFLGPLSDQAIYEDHIGRFSTFDDNAQLGHAVSAAGDINDDGFDDIAIGAPGALADNGDAVGAVYFFLGPIGSNFDVSDAETIATGSLDGQKFGYVLGGSGDYDGDGRPDFAIGALGPSDQTEITNSGAVYVFLSTGI